MNSQPRKKVGLALSGGFVRATAAIGVIEVLRLHNIPIDMISGCSAGSGIAGAYVNGQLEAIKHRLINTNRRDYFHTIIEPTMPKEGLLKGQRTREFFKLYVGDKDFKDLETPLFVTATDLNTLSPVVINTGKIHHAIQASVGVPGLWMPVKWNGMILSDGGNFYQIPSAPLYDNGADYVIALDTTKPPNFIIRSLSALYQKYGKDKKLENKIFTDNRHVMELVKRAVYLATVRIENFYHSSYRYDILIQPKVSRFKRWHVKKVRDIIEEGRKAAEEAVPQIKKDLGIE